METINQLIVITGARGTGKTTLAATYRKPSELKKVVYADSEKSANNFRAGLLDAKLGDFGQYLDLQERFQDLPDDNDLLDRISKGNPPWVSVGQQGALIDYYEYMLGQLAGIPRDTYNTLVIDTIEKLEAGMAAYVDKNKAKFGVTTTAYGKLWSEGVFPLYQNLLQGIYGRGIETIILVSHLKNVWEGSHPVPGKVSMSGKKILYTLSSLMLWLVNDSRNPNGEPAALVIKERMGKIATVDDDWSIKSMLPPRIPTCTWKEIRRYLEVGYNISDPHSREKRSPAEDEMISDLYTDAQLALMLADAKLQEQQTTLEIVKVGGVSIGTAEDAKPIVKSSNNVPSNRLEALNMWRNMGRKIPDFNHKLTELGVDDDQIVARWLEIIE